MTALCRHRTVEMETRERFGFREPDGRDEPGETVPPTSQAMAAGGGEEMVNCYDDALHADYPGNTACMPTRCRA